MQCVREDLRTVETLLRQAQQADESKRLWLLTVTWGLLHDVAIALNDYIAADLGEQPPTKSDELLPAPIAESAQQGGV